MLRIVDMQEEHYKGKAYVHFHAWIETYKEFMNQEFLSKKNLKNCLKIAETYAQNTLVALKNDQVVGFASFHASSDNELKTGEIYAIYVLKAYQNEGVGSALLKACLIRLETYSKVVLYVLDQNENAISWYQRQGFEFDGRVKNAKTSIEGYFLKELRMQYTNKAQVKHFMSLHDEPFEMIKNGLKTIELRLNDEKRQNIKIGDLIIFKKTDHEDEMLYTQVMKVHHFSNFKTLYQTLPLDKCGYSKDEIKNAHEKDMLFYYSQEQQDQYGVIGIEIKMIG